MHREDEFFEKIRVAVRSAEPKEYTNAKYNAFLFNRKLCVPQNEEVKGEIMSEAHDTPYIAHLGSKKCTKI